MDGCGILTQTLLLHLLEVEISFTEDTVMVDEGMGVLSLQLKAEGIYTTRFSLTVSCLDVFPVQAKGKWQNSFVLCVYQCEHLVLAGFAFFSLILEVNLLYYVYFCSVLCGLILLSLCSLPSSVGSED